MTKTAWAPERRRRAWEVLGKALELLPARRAAYLERIGSAEPELRADVERLLLLECRELEPLTSLDPNAGRCIGAWALLHQLGRGGAGDVYLAERADKPTRGALKLARGGAATSTAHGRLRHEAETLARLNHPSVVRLLDPGARGHGEAPTYFVMEYVTGEPLDLFFATRRLSLRERLEIFLAICEAVSYVHAAGIVHRDVKPSNLLVAADGKPKLLDFGVAARLGADGLAAADGAPLSLAYASPQRIRGERVGPTEDVFSLGLVLCELLCGKRPHCGAAERLGLVLAGQRVPVARLEDLPVQKDLGLDGQLLDEIDRIAHGALREEPAERWSSAGRLAEEVSRCIQSFSLGGQS